MDYVQGRQWNNYITTDVVFSQTDSVFIDFELTSTPVTDDSDSNASYCCIYGMFTSNSFTGYTDIFRGLNYGRTSIYSSFPPFLVYKDYTNNNPFITISTGAKRYRLSLCCQLVLDDGVSMITEDLTKVSIPLSFLYWYGGNVGLMSTSFIRLYRCAIVALDGTTTHDFLPCENPSGEEGLYDVVGRVFYGFSTT